MKTTRGWSNRTIQHAGHADGFDGGLFCCIDLATGKRRWKKGRYGHGQVVLLEANPKSHVELAKFQAIEGKTWNHPVIVRDQLFIRNGEQIACYRLPLQTAEGN